jgi:hypothetical protein
VLFVEHERASAARHLGCAHRGCYSIPVILLFLFESARIYHPDDRQLVSARGEKAIAHGTPFSFEARIVRPDVTVTTEDAASLTATSSSVTVPPRFPHGKRERARSARFVRTLEPTSGFEPLTC